MSFLTSRRKKRSGARESFFEGLLKKKGNLREREFERHKDSSLRTSVVAGLVAWLAIGIFDKSILRSAAMAILLTIMLFLFLLQVPAMKRRKAAKRFESDLPFFLLHLATEIRTGKGFAGAMRDSCGEDNQAARGFRGVLDAVKKGLSFREALEKMNKKFDSLNVKRAMSNLSNIQRHGKRDVTSIRKLAEELLAKQRIESKEFGNKMVVYSLVFIAVSAIVPAMFQSFILIGSYFMSIRFTAEQVFLIIVVLFPLVDIGILGMINAKTPEFLKNNN